MELNPAGLARKNYIKGLFVPQLTDELTDKLLTAEDKVISIAEELLEPMKQIIPLCTRLVSYSSTRRNDQFLSMPSTFTSEQFPHVTYGQNGYTSLDRNDVITSVSSDKNYMGARDNARQVISFKPPSITTDEAIASGLHIQDFGHYNSLVTLMYAQIDFLFLPANGDVSIIKAKLSNYSMNKLVESFRASIPQVDHVNSLCELYRLNYERLVWIKDNIENLLDDCINIARRSFGFPSLPSNVISDMTFDEKLKAGDCLAKLGVTKYDQLCDASNNLMTAMIPIDDYLRNNPYKVCRCLTSYDHSDRFYLGQMSIDEDIYELSFTVNEDEDDYDEPICDIDVEDRCFTLDVTLQKVGGIDEEFHDMTSNICVWWQTYEALSTINLTDYDDDISYGIYFQSEVTGTPDITPRLFLMELMISLSPVIISRFDKAIEKKLEELNS